MKVKTLVAILAILQGCLSVVWGASGSFYWDGSGPVSERRVGKLAFTFGIGRAFTEVKSVKLSIQSAAVTRGETSVSFNGTLLGELKDVGGDFFDIATTSFDVPTSALVLPSASTPVAVNKLVVEIKDGYGTLAWITTSPRLIISGAYGLSLTASDGDYEEYVQLNWIGGADGETYILKRGDETIAEGLQGTSYQDKDAVPGDVYTYEVSGSISGGSAKDEGYRMPPPPKLGRLHLEGCSISELGLAGTNRFLVAGHGVTADAELMDYDTRYYKFVSAKLIGTHFEHDVATLDHLAENMSVVGLNGTPLLCLSGILQKGSGYHGNYKSSLKNKLNTV